MKSALLAFVILNSPFFASLAVEVDGVAAKVGTETILASEVREEMRRMNAPESAYADVRRELIDRKLILKAAAEAKVTMQDWVVESRVQDIVRRAFGGDRNRLMELLSRQKIAYPEWRARMKDDMIVSALRWNVIDKNVTASPSAIRREFADHPDRYATEGKMTVSVILLKPEDLSRRDEVSSALATNDFAAVAKTFSADSHAADGGVWREIVPSEVFKPEICTELAQMPRGTVSHWIELDGWSFLLRKDAETPGQPRTFEEAYDDVVAHVKEERSKAAYADWIDRLRSETYIKIY